MSLLEPYAVFPVGGTVGTHAKRRRAFTGAGSADAIPSLRLVIPGVMALLLAVQVVLVLHALDGHFSYTLDDPYIHLALADQIAGGHYGLSPLVPAAPSSSILFPFLLAALSFTRVGQFAPLILNSVATLSSGFLLALLIEDIFPAARLRLGPMLLLGLAFSLGLNLIGLALTGMEHAVQVTVTLAWVLGALRFLRTAAIARWWWLCALAEPLIRYEGGLIWLATVLLFIHHRRRGAGLGLLLCGVGLLGAFSAFLHGLGLPILPSSVLVKSQLTNTGDAIAATSALGHVLYTVKTNLVARDAPLLVITTLALALLVERKRHSRDAGDRGMARLAVIGIALSVAQFTLGRVDPQGRYTIFVLVLHVVLLMAGFPAEIIRVVPRLRWLAWAGILGLIANPVSGNVQRSLWVGLSARNIYEQQYQMHRMATEFYRAPVAVNDLGWVSYRNPFAVLDLWGLGSEEARLARAGDATPRWMDTLTARHNVGLAMIYDRWFPSRPGDWVPLAHLTLGVERMTAGDDTVTFYATGPDHVAAVAAALDRLAPQLPADVGLDRIGANAGGGAAPP